MKFSKLQATGNDFILIENRITHNRSDISSGLYFDVDLFGETKWAEIINNMCDRHFGIGADGVIVVQNSSIADLKMRIYNSDGSEAEACGNGLRCFTKYSIERSLSVIDYMRDDNSFLSIETMAGIRKAMAYRTGKFINSVEVTMGLPEFKAEKIPVSNVQNGLTIDCNPDSPLIGEYLLIKDNKLFLWLLSMGNPHAVTFLSHSTDDFPLSEYGPIVEKHQLFPKRTNFEIARVIDRNNIEARVWERSVGETLACGSGACAIAVTSKLLGYTEDDVNITLRGGVLNIFWDGIAEVKLTGSVNEVFTGEYLV